MSETAATRPSRDGAGRWEAYGDTLLRSRRALPGGSGGPSRAGPRGGAAYRVASLVAAAGRPRPSIEVAGVRHHAIVPEKHGLALFNRRAKLHVGSTLRTSGRARIPPLASEPSRVPRAEALGRALAAAGVRELRGDPVVERGWLALERETAPAWRVTLPARDPFGTWQVLLDARSGEVFSRVDLVRYATGSGRVYAPNRVVAADVTSLAPLFDLDDDSGLLAGRIARVIDEREIEAFRPDLVFDFPAGPPEDPRFVQTSVYRGLTDTGRFGEAHGFPAFALPLLAFTNLPGSGLGGEFNNAFYDPTVPLFGFGNGDGVVLANLGTDMDVAAHEMGHHLFELLVDPLVLSSGAPVLAMHEGVADVVAALVTGDPDIGESILPGQPFLRTVDNGAIFPDDVDPDPHLTGLIVGGLSWDLAQALGSDPFADLLLASLPFLPSDPLFLDAYLDALLDGDQALNGGANDALIRTLAAARGLESLEDLGFRGFVVDGVPVSTPIGDGEIHLYLFSELPGSPSLQFATAGTGDVDLIVIGVFLDFDPADPSTFEDSSSFGSTELVTLDAVSSPSVHDDDVWLVGVGDFAGLPGGSTYTLTVDATLPAPDLALPGSLIDSLVDFDDFDTHVFQGAAGDVVRVEAAALTPGFDPLVGVLDARTGEVLAANDDSGPGLDALIQGVLLPTTDSYVVGVITPIGDVEPGTGGGSYELTLSSCDNGGANLDGDALADACDDDDDGDGFLDDLDAAPLDPTVCDDLDDDLCDDCTSGVFDRFSDGPDADADSVCDLGDPDDDNDGCADPGDPAPATPSVDDDLDFLGSDCDNCPAVPNTDQADADGDGSGDACDPCPALADAVDPDGDGACGAADLCPFAANPGQLDSGAVGSDPPDGIGDACQCGDVNDDGVVDIADAAALERDLGGLGPGLVAPGKCNVVGLGCDDLDSLVLRFALADLVPIQQMCDPALLRRALDLNGVDEQLGNATPQPLGIANAWTLSAWVKPGSRSPLPIARLGVPAPAALDGLVRLELLGGEPGDPYEVVVGGSGGVSAKQYRGPTALEPGRWMHLAASWDGVELALYVDGARIPDAALEKVLDGAPLQDDAQPRVAHVGSAPGGGSHLDGRLGHIAVWSAALPPASIQQVRGLGHAIDLRADLSGYQHSADLVHYWRPGEDPDLLSPDLVGALDLGADAVNLTVADDVVEDAP